MPSARAATLEPSLGQAEAPAKLSPSFVVVVNALSYALVAPSPNVREVVKQKRPNQSIELTANRGTIHPSMSLTLQSAATRALARSSSSCSR